MENLLSKAQQQKFHLLKLTKKQQLTKNTFSLEFDVPQDLRAHFHFEAGQYVTLQYPAKGQVFRNDYSITAAPYENKLTLGIKINSPESSTNDLFHDFERGDSVEVSEPKGRFVLRSKPHEFRTIIGFAGGIGITPLLSHFKNILHNEPRTRLFLFYGNKTKADVPFKEELDELVQKHQNRFAVHYFFSREKVGNAFLEGRLDEHKLRLIINQLMMIDETDEEATLWDSVDEVLICGKGEMIRSLANACYHNGIPKKNIHFELFEEFNEDIYPQEKAFPVIEDIEVDFKLFHKKYTTRLKDNKMRLLQQLLIQQFPVPYSCKSGICGSCECVLEEGEVELLENEYLTEKEEQSGRILACMSVVLSKKIKVNFDLD